ncbi:alpha/beta hydrolase [Nocardia panacis]|uniref:Alpha/beta hydrolase n=1 Tax=Nocardia panacis TaxID=2340916 RepID=A0A3A4KI35_9NOCA|nr:alpha/beta hydrolase [Nocardia panacis]RJO79279.1 alpha/beta hydrolase [Nocardia panacis]
MSTAPTTSTRRGAPLTRLLRGALLLIATLLGLFAALAQLAAIIPVGWTKPLLRNDLAQTAFLLLGGLRDPLGSWNVALAVVAVLIALVALRMRGRRRLAGAITLLAATGLALALVTGVGLMVSVHSATGRWITFAPEIPYRQAGEPPTRTVEYATFDGVPLRADLYLPETAAPAPLVLSIHGGAFIMGHRGTNPYTTWLADQGYAVLDIDYRLADDRNHRWDTEEGDAACALTWANAYAAEFRLDMNRVATMGGSAGGNLAINVANKVNAGALQPTCGTAADLPKVRAVLALYPAVDLTASGTETAVGVDAARQYVGGPPSQFPDRFTAVDSGPHLTKASPPTLIIQGGGDHLVLAEHSAAFAKRLADAGIPNSYVELPFLDHGFGGTSLDTGAQVTRELGLSWLRRYL